MKKLLVVIMLFVVLFTSTQYICEANQVGQGFAIVFNGETTDHTSVIINNKHYVPVRMIFEKMGASVFYRNSDRQILALSRDGDIIRHIIGSNIVDVSGEKKTFEYPSVSHANITYIPLDMVSVIFYPDSISYANQQIIIQKQFLTNEYHKVINDVLDVSNSNNFYPERFQRYLNYHVKMPNYSMQEILFNVNLGFDFPFYENVTTIEHPYELLVLVNKYNKLPADFRQYNLVKMDKKFTVNDGKEYLLAGVAYEKFVQMSDDAKKEGLSLRVISAYRTESYQRGLYNNKLWATGKVNAERYSARPGHSEHQTGLAVDVNSTSGSFEYTAVFRWLQIHAHEYGFILRYPKGKEQITGYAYEPWHYRFVGTDAAKIIYDEGITYEEYYAKYVSVNEFR